MNANRAGLPGSCDVAIVGAGPSGLAAATRLRERGVGSVVVLDREREAGGIPRHCGHYPFGMREFKRIMRGPDYAKRLVNQTWDSGASFFPRTSVVSIDEGPALQVTTRDGPTTLLARRIMLCTGVREMSRAARFIGGERTHGIVSTGALQSLIYLKEAVPFKNPVILGTELVSFSAILTCRHAGIKPVAMIEENPRITARDFAAHLPRMLGIPIHLQTGLVKISGDQGVKSVVVRDADGQEREIECDGVIISGQFTPEASLARMSGIDVCPCTGGPVIDQYGHTSDPKVFASGNLLRPVETAGWSWREGQRMGETVARSLGRKLPPPTDTARMDIASDALSWVMPQRIALPLTAHGLDALQLRVARPFKGTLTFSQNGETLHACKIDTLPERRILVPLKKLAKRMQAGTVQITAEESS